MTCKEFDNHVEMGSRIRDYAEGYNEFLIKVRQLEAVGGVLLVLFCGSKGWNGKYYPIKFM